MVITPGSRRKASPIRLAAAIACRMPKKMKLSGVAKTVTNVISAAAPPTTTMRFRKAAGRHFEPCASIRLTPARNRKLPAMDLA